MKLQILVEIEVASLDDAVAKLNQIKNFGMSEMETNIIGPHQVVE